MSFIVVELARVIAAQAEEIEAFENKIEELENEVSRSNLEQRSLKEDLKRADTLRLSACDLIDEVNKQNASMEQEIRDLRAELANLKQPATNDDVSWQHVSARQRAYNILFVAKDGRFVNGFPLVGTNERYDLVSEIHHITAWPIHDAGQFVCDFLDRKLDEHGEVASPRSSAGGVD